jgi:MFS family permease
VPEAGPQAVPRPGTPLRQSLELLFTRRFGTFWLASLLANIGTWAQQVAQPWLMLSLGASPILLGIDAFAGGAPALLLIFVGGTLADRSDRRRVIATFQSIQMLCPVLLVVLLVAGQVDPWIIIAMSLVVGITDALSMPSFQTIVSSIVDKDRLAAALGLNATQFNLSRILGPAIAGALMAGVGATGAFAVSAASYVPFILVALWILPRRMPRPDDAPPLDRTSAMQAIRHVAGDTALRGALLTVFVTSTLCSPLLTFSPILVRDAFAGNVAHFSGAVAAFGLGGLLAAAGLLTVDARRDRRPIATTFALAFAGTVVLVALDPWAWGLPLLFTLAGLAMTASNVSINAFIQVTAPPSLRGRSISLFMLAMRGGMSIGGLLTGLSVSWLGVRHALLVNGLLAALLLAINGLNWRSGRRVEASPELSQAPDQAASVAR